jgi:hypothetical protein
MTDELLEFKLNFFEDEIKKLNKKVESIEINLIQKIENIEEKIIKLTMDMEKKPLQEKSKKWEAIIDMIFKSVIVFLLLNLGLPA